MVARLVYRRAEPCASARMLVWMLSCVVHNPELPADLLDQMPRARRRGARPARRPAPKPAGLDWQI